METCWNVTIQDTSPIFKYSPYTDGGAQGWTGVFAGGEQVVNGMLIGTGDTQHVTNGQAEAKIVFNGTAVYLTGAIMGTMQYEVELDGKVTPGQPNGGLLASFTELSSKQEHNLVLRSKPQASGDWLGLHSAIVTVGTGLTGAAPATMIKEEDDAAWSYGRGFTPAINPVTNAGMRRSLAAGDWAALTFSGHSVIVHGPKNIDHGQYSVALDGKTQIFNGTSRVMVGDTVLFYQSGMDSLKTHVMNITNLDDRALDIDYAEIITVQGGSQYDPASANTGSTVTPGGPNVAAILGGVIGGLLLLLIAVFVFWFSRRRNAKQTSTEEGSTNPAPAPAPAPPAADDWKPEMTMAAPLPVVIKPSTGPRIRWGELTRPGMGEAPTTERSETPPALRPMPSILRRQESTNSVAPLLVPATMNRSEDEVSLASTANSGPNVSTSSLAVAIPDSRRSSTVSPIPAAPVRPPRPPQNLFDTGEVPKFPEPDISATQSSTLNEDPFNPTTAETPQTNIGSRFSDSTVAMPNPFEETETTSPPNTASPPPDKQNDLKLQTEDIPQPSPEQRSAGQARRDLLVALETDQVTTISRSGTRKVGLPSNPRAGLSRQ